MKTCQCLIDNTDLTYNVSLSTGLNIDIRDIKIMHYAGYKPNSVWVNALPFAEIWYMWENEFKNNILPIIENPIPKIIHCVWLGKNKKSQKIQKCMDSWKKYLSDYKIMEWNEDNFDIESIKYVKEAYDKKKYAFCTDYIRLWALYNHGGIYMDCDVEVLRPLDVFLKHRAFTGHETNDLMVTATMGAEKKHPWIKMLLDYYTDLEFNEIPNTITITNLSKPLVQKYEFDYRFLSDGVVIYPKEVFAPYNHLEHKSIPNESSYCIHHFAGSWLDRSEDL